VYFLFNIGKAIASIQFTKSDKSVGSYRRNRGLCSQAMGRLVFYIGFKRKRDLYNKLILTKISSGTIADYYKPRWARFITALNSSLVSGKPFQSKRFRKSVLLHVERPFTFSTKLFPTSATG